jgi:RNA polymerase sigma-70 factor (ECF subfamily)
MDETLLIEFLRGGDEGAFAWLVQQYHNSLKRLAWSYLQDERLAEEIAQETWVAVLKGLERFEGRSSLKTWIFTILTNKAKTHGQREKRIIFVPEVEGASNTTPTVDSARFRPSNSDTFAGHWVEHPSSWEDFPEEQILSRETLDIVRQVISTLPDNQRAVITLRDIEEFSSNEVCNILGISETNQRVLLHRARAKVRGVLEKHLSLEN